MKVIEWVLHREALPIADTLSPPASQAALGDVQLVHPERAERDGDGSDDSEIHFLRSAIQLGQCCSFLSGNWNLLSLPDRIMILTLGKEEAAQWLINSTTHCQPSSMPRHLIHLVFSFTEEKVKQYFFCNRLTNTTWGKKLYACLHHCFLFLFVLFAILYIKVEFHP